SRSARVSWVSRRAEPLRQLLPSWNSSSTVIRFAYRSETATALRSRSVIRNHGSSRLRRSPRLQPTAPLSVPAPSLPYPTRSPPPPVGSATRPQPPPAAAADREVTQQPAEARVPDAHVRLDADDERQPDLPAGLGQLRPAEAAVGQEDHSHSGRELGAQQPQQ